MEIAADATDIRRNVLLSLQAAKLILLRRIQLFAPLADFPRQMVRVVSGIAHLMLQFNLLYRHQSVDYRNYMGLQ